MPSNTGLMRFKLADGTEVVFETALPPEAGEELMGRKGGEIPEARERFDVLVQRIRSPRPCWMP